MDIVIVGSGPTALMVAERVADSGYAVGIFEKRASPGRKLLVAGSSGLNISNGLELEAFAQTYSGARPEYWRQLLTEFSPQQWVEFVEELGLSTFLGSSDRYFVKEMKASGLLRAWVKRLQGKGVSFHFNHELRTFSADPHPKLTFYSGQVIPCQAVCLALGGGSWEKTPVTWPEIFIDQGLKFEPFSAANVGYQVAWAPDFLREAEGLALKGISLCTERGQMRGEVVVTQYGLEGTPIYSLGARGMSFWDLQPDKSEVELLKRLSTVKENLSPLRRIKKQLQLAPATLALIFHHAPEAVKASRDLKDWAHCLKNFPLELLGPQPIAEAISSRGGLSFEELDAHMMIKRMPGFFAAGEMLNWDAPTGGFLIQACVSQGHWVGKSMLQFLKR